MSGSRAAGGAGARRTATARGAGNQVGLRDARGQPGGGDVAPDRLGDDLGRVPAGRPPVAPAPAAAVLLAARPPVGPRRAAAVLLASRPPVGPGPAAAVLLASGLRVRAGPAGPVAVTCGAGRRPAAEPVRRRRRGAGDRPRVRRAGFLDARAGDGRAGDGRN